MFGGSGRFGSAPGAPSGRGPGWPGAPGAPGAAFGAGGGALRSPPGRGPSSGRCTGRPGTPGAAFGAGGCALRSAPGGAGRDRGGCRDPADHDPGGTVGTVGATLRLRTRRGLTILAGSGRCWRGSGVSGRASGRRSSRGWRAAARLLLCFAAAGARRDPAAARADPGAVRAVRAAAAAGDAAGPAAPRGARDVAGAARAPRAAPAVRGRRAVRARGAARGVRAGPVRDRRARGHPARDRDGGRRTTRPPGPPWPGPPGPALLGAPLGHDDALRPRGGDLGEGKGGQDGAGQEKEAETLHRHLVQYGRYRTSQRPNGSVFRASCGPARPRDRGRSRGRRRARPCGSPPC